MKKVWITGAAGHVGSVLARLLDCREYEIIATDADECDITDLSAVHSYCVITRPDFIINCAGYTDVSACEQDPETAYRVNALGPRNLAQEAQQHGATLIQISTDDVFSQDGSVPYNEFDPVSPHTVYGKSKYAGEQLVRDLVSHYIIVRSSWVYGVGRDFVSTVLAAAETGGELAVPCNHFACPTSAKELARVIMHLIEDDAACGIYHAVCCGACSRYEFARAILEEADMTDRLILKPFLDESRARPSYSVLDNLMLRISGMDEPQEWRAALSEYMRETGGVE